MASKSGQRVRLVKCPKCLKILQEDEDVPVYQCGGCSTILQAKRRTIAPNTTPSVGGTEGVSQASEPRSEPETNNVSSSSGQDTALPSPTVRSSGQVDEKALDESMESTEEQLGGSIGEEGNEIQLQDTFLPSPTGLSSGQVDEKALDGSMESTEKQLGGSIGEEGNEIQLQDMVLPSPTGRSSGQADEKALDGSMESTEKQLGGSIGEEGNEIQLQDTVLPSPTGRSSGPDDEMARDGSTEATEKQLGGSIREEGNEIQLQDTVPLPTGRSSGQLDEKARDGSMESTEKQLGGSIGEDEIQLQERSLGHSNKNEEDNSSRLNSDIKSVAETMGQVTSSGSLNADHVVDARTSNSSSDAFHKLEAEISPDASPVEEEQTEDDYFFNRHRKSTGDLPANKTSSAYDGSESSSEEREDQLLDENEQWKALQKIRSGKFEMQRYPENFKEQGGSSSSTFSEKRPNGTTTYKERYQNRSLQLEGPGGRLGRQGRRHVTEQLRPDIPFYPREPYTRVSPSYPSHDEFDPYSRAHSLQIPPYAGGMNYEGVDHMYHNNTRARGRGQGSRFSGEMANDRRNHAGWYSGQLHSSYSSYTASPQRPMEQPEYYPRWSSDVEDHQRNRYVSHHHDLQARRLKERQLVAKRHIRPTAGGAPFVSCYSCSENLQLPADFLIFKRKYHLLRCGTCTTVLRFSLQSRTHLIPAVTHDINANRSSNSTSESPRDKAPSKPEKPSSSAQEEDVPVARGSPLHRLMGYSTVSQVFKVSQRPPSV